MSHTYTKKNVLILAIIISIITIGLTLLAFNYYSKQNVLKVFEIPMHIKVVNTSNIGLNVQTDALYFGKVPRGDGSSHRKFDINNNFDTDAIVTINAHGDELANWITLSDNNFLLKKKSAARINISANVPSDANIGNYTSNLTITLFKYRQNG